MQNALAGYVCQEMALDAARLQIGARLEVKEALINRDGSGYAQSLRHGSSTIRDGIVSSPLLALARFSFLPDPSLLIRASLTATTQSPAIPGLYTFRRPAAGSVLANMLASHRLPKGTAMQVFPVKVSNSGNADSRDHTSLIKDSVPEMVRHLPLTSALGRF